MDSTWLFQPVPNTLLLVGSLITGPDEPEAGFTEWSSQPAAPAKLSDQLRPAILSVVLLALLAGGAFPLLLFAIACPLFPHQANGSLVTRGGAVVGSKLLGQEFTRPEFLIRGLRRQAAAMMECRLVVPTSAQIIPG